MEVDEMPDDSWWGGWLACQFCRPSPKLEITMKKRELARRIFRLDMQVRMYEKQRAAAARKLKAAVKNGAPARRQTLIATEIAKYESMQDACAFSVVKYQQGILTLERLDQMRQTTTDFADVTRMLANMNKQLNLRRTASMARK
jgi:hypothetical protein